MEFLAATTAPAGLCVFFGLLLLLVVGAGFDIFRQRKQFFGYHGEEGDT